MCVNIRQRFVSVYLAQQNQKRWQSNYHNFDLQSLKEKEPAMNGLIVKKFVQTCHLTPNDWEVYTSMKGSAEAVEEINRVVEQVCNNSTHSRQEAERLIDKVLVKHRKLGAYDTEPRRVRTMILDEIFGEEE
jgi:hypothetical protein